MRDINKKNKIKSLLILGLFISTIYPLITVFTPVTSADTNANNVIVERGQDYVDVRTGPNEVTRSIYPVPINTYDESSGNFVPINLTLKKKGSIISTENNPFNLFFDTENGYWQYNMYNDSSKIIRFTMPTLIDDASNKIALSAKDISFDYNTIFINKSDYRLEIELTYGQVQLRYILKNEKAPKKIDIPYSFQGSEMNVDILQRETKNLISDGSGKSIDPSVSYEGNIISITVDDKDLKYPITVDPTTSTIYGQTYDGSVAGQRASWG